MTATGHSATGTKYSTDKIGVSGNKREKKHSPILGQEDMLWPRTPGEKRKGRAQGKRREGGTRTQSPGDTRWTEGERCLKCKHECAVYEEK